MSANMKRSPFVRRQRPARYDAVEVQMGAELLIPGVEKTGETDLPAKTVIGVFPESLQRLAGGSKQQVVDWFFVLHHLRYGIEPMRERENHMKIRHREQLLAPGLHPAGAGHRLTFRAVAVAAGVVVDLLESALLAPLDTSPHPVGATLPDVTHNPVMLQGNRMLLEIRLTVEAKDVGHLTVGGRRVAPGR
ncbi:hypothetical protein AKJ51_02350 [candidate division MSBL1 archaeon SCGC-AAA382A20]|uniref:Uncharacterized protein n=1 Tax=candidate division MSBL1 archaeon SCGC-AAA382A20 TaxID=1698280 RepID=A0A133VKK0_9EURY|nr:hypothetical protein AKJ51_02350 [candidate division MSBL1 archaeon SCGC-AAA382A20]